MARNESCGGPYRGSAAATFVRCAASMTMQQSQKMKIFGHLGATRIVARANQKHRERANHRGRTNRERRRLPDVQLPGPDAAQSRERNRDLLTTRIEAEKRILQHARRLDGELLAATLRRRVHLVGLPRLDVRS